MVAYSCATQHPDELSAAIMIGALTSEAFSWPERFWRRDSYVPVDFAATVFGRERAMWAMHWLYGHLEDTGDVEDVEKASEIAANHAKAYPEMRAAERERLQRGWADYLTMYP
ncbi:hypothetical protein BRC93_10005 [Halobacteriales archaeon QS_5_70_15]|nr:MAG: hypothetical protein BRC93_10005 [Halobacteriales archaeon QS_5_70_15]